MSQHFLVTSSVSDGVPVITVTGEIDLATVPTLQEALLSAVPERLGRVVVDLTDVSFCDSSGLAVFLHAHQLAQNYGKTLHVAGAQERVLRVLSMTEMDHLFTLHDTLAEALAAARDSVPSVGISRLV